MALSQGDDATFGARAVQNGLITNAQLKAALKVLAQEALGGTPRPLSEVLVSEGALTPDQVRGLVGRDVRPESSIPFGKYRLLRELGRGGMGVVFEALDQELNRKVAVKMLLTSPNAGPEEVRIEEERFLREARLSASLPPHPQIVGVYEAGVIDGKRYLTMELVAGQQMDRWGKSGSVTLRQQVVLLRDIALAVHHAHRHKIIHRDLKPQNILVDARNHPRVTDFGLAKIARQDAKLSLTASGMVMGTPAYMSPEQARGEKSIDGRTDTYALGVMLYEILTGRTPFRGETAIEILMKAANENPVPPTQISRTGGVDAGIEGICLKAMARNREDRFPNAQALAGELTRWLKGEEVSATAPRRGSESRTRRLVGAAVALALAATVAVAVWPSDRIAEDLARAESLLEKGKEAEAAVLFGEVLRKQPGNAAAEDGRERARRAVEKRKKSADSASKQKAASEVSALLDEAGRLVREGRAVEALGKYALILEKDRANESALRGKAEAESRLGKPAPPAPEASAASSVELDLGAADAGRGLALRTSGDARYERTTYEGSPCVRTVHAPGTETYLLLDVDDAWARGTAMLEADVEYFEGPYGYFNLQYDSTDADGIYKSTSSTQLLNSNGWKSWTFFLLNPAFENRQNAGADFRIRFSPQGHEADLYLRRIRLRRANITTPIAKPPLPFRAAAVPAGTLQAGLAAEIFEGVNFDRRVARKIDLRVRHDWSVEPAPEGMKSNFSIRWTGYFKAPRAGTYFISVESDDGVEVFIDDSAVLLDWTPHTARPTIAQLTLDPGLHEIFMEYFQGGGEASVRLDMYFREQDRLLPVDDAFHHASGDASPPSPRERGGRVWIEGEAMKVLESTGTVEPQDTGAWGHGWSRGRHLWWYGGKPGDLLRLGFEYPAEGRRTLKLALVRAATYSIVKVAVNGVEAKEPVDLYHGSVSPWGEVSIDAPLRKGTNEVQIRIVGINPRAIPHYQFALDFLRIGPGP